MTHNEQQQQHDSGEADANAAAPSDADDALDAIVGELRLLLAKQHAGTVHAEELAVSIGAWLAILVGHVRLVNISEQRLGDAEADGDAEDIADVLAMVLSACLQNKWRKMMVTDSDPIGPVLFHTGNMTVLLAFLSALLLSRGDDKMDLQPDPTLAACEAIYALGRLAQRESEIKVVLAAWQESPLASRRLTLFERVEYLVGLETTTEQQRLALCFVRFVSDALNKEKKMVHKDYKPVLRGLAGRDVPHWRQHTWEQRWQLFDSPFFCMGTFGYASDSEAMVKRILQGFSIPQVDATDVAANLDLVSFLLSTDFDELLGLRHKVDVTLVKDGKTHPDWHLNDVLRFEDVMDAFKNKYTIGIRGVHARSQLISYACSALQDEIKQHVNANIYCELVQILAVELLDQELIHGLCVCECTRTGTPPGEQGFNLHVDDHCVFVIQLKGKKNWHLKEHIGVLPSLYSDLSEPAETGATDQLVLVPGNVLYIPRGIPHCADTKGLAESSIHLTIGVEIEMQFTKQELVLELLSKLRLEDSTVVVDQVQVDKTIKAAMKSEMLRNEMRGGLMSWHLENDFVFKRELAELLSKLHDALEVSSQEETTSDERQDGDGKFQESRKLVKETLKMYTTSDEKVASLRRKVLEDRDAFLSSRQKLTDMFTLLHRSLHGGDTTAAPKRLVKSQTNKKIKLEGSWSMKNALELYSTKD